MRILVLGGTAFIGSFTVQLLKAQGHSVAALHRTTGSAILPNSVEHITGDRHRLGDLVVKIRQFRPDVVLDMICFTQSDAEGLTAALHTVAQRVVVVSSMDVYRARDRFCRADVGEPDRTPLTEDSPLRDRLFPYSEERWEAGTDGYSQTYEKILVERSITDSWGARATIVRLPMVYGPRDRQHRFFEYIKRMDEARPYILLEQAMADWRAPRGYVEDMAYALTMCVTDERAAGRIYHVGDKENLTEAECVKRVGSAVGWPGELVTAPNEKLPAHLRHEYDTRQNWSLDSTRIRTELGYIEPTEYEVAMQRTVEWERANPPASVDPAQFDYAAEDEVLKALKLG